MTGPLVAMLLAVAAWTDATGHLRCEVPDGFQPLPDQPWAFVRSDGLRRLVFLPVRPISEGPDARAKQLLERIGATGGLLRGAPDVATALAISPTTPTWAGVLVLGPAASDVTAEAQSLIATCRAVKPLLDAGRIRDATRRMACAIPAGGEAFELRGAGAVRGPGWTLRLISVQSKGTASLAELASKWLQPSVAVVESVTPGVAGGRATATASGRMLQGAVDYVVEVTAVELPNGDVAGIGLSTSAQVQSQARAATEQMLSTLEVDEPAH